MSVLIVYTVFVVVCICIKRELRAGVEGGGALT